MSEKNTDKTYVSNNKGMITILRTGFYYGPKGHDGHHLVEEGKWVVMNMKELLNVRVENHGFRMIIN